MILPGFDDINPEVVWGIVPRLVGVLFAVSMGSLINQVVGIAGERGNFPARQRLGLLRRHFGGLKPYLDAPTLLWLRPTDGMLRGLAVVGALAGVVAIYGGEVGWWALLVAWLCFLSLDTVACLIFPWDSLLLEVGFLVLFLPQTEALPGVAAVAAPLPAVGFMFRWLVIRLMWGFAKLKFIGTEKGDVLYLKGFFAWMPVPNPLGWYAHHAPNWFLKASLYFMFFAEVVAPGLCFIPGDLRVIGALSLIGLMVGIQATGNWGYFNLGYIALCVVFFDVHGSIADIADQPLAALYSPWPHLVTNLVMLWLFAASLVSFLLNTWCNRTWMYWHWDNVTHNRPVLRALVWMFRRMAPFRMSQAYGVFPPNAGPPMRMTPVFEGSNDGEHWQPYIFKYIPTVETQAPSVIAPHHPRLDHATPYAGGGIHDGGLISSLCGDGTPHLSYCRSSWLDRTLQRLLEGDPATLASFKHSPFATPPQYGRVSMHAFTPTSLRERKETGRWWRRRRVGTLIEATAYDPYILENWLPEPEVFHPDWVYWKRRSKPVQAVLEAFRGGRPADEAALEGSDLTPEDVQVFWEQFVPFVNEQRGRWEDILLRVEQLRQRFDRDALWRMERLLERYCLLLREVVEPHYLGRAQPTLQDHSNYRLHLVLHEVVLDGPGAVESALREPARIISRAARCTDASLLYSTALLRWEAIRYQIRAFRWSDFRVEFYGQRLPGICEFKEFLEAIEPPEENWRPAPEKSPAGEWEIDDFYPVPEPS